MKYNMTSPIISNFRVVKDCGVILNFLNNITPLNEGHFKVFLHHFHPNF